MFNHFSYIFSAHTFLDLHSGNILLRMPKSIDNLTPDQLYQQYSQPVYEPVVRRDGEKTTDNSVPTHVVIPVWLGKASENVTLPEAQIYLIDFGESFMPSLTIRAYSNTPKILRPPELYFLPDRPVSFAADIWTLGCTIFSILGNRPLFEAFPLTDGRVTREHVDALGNLPPDWWNSWSNRGKWFNEEGERKDGQSRRPIEERFEYSVQEPRRERGMGEMGEDEKSALIALLRAMLAFRPEERPTAKEITESEWMKNWALLDMVSMRQESKDEHVEKSKNVETGSSLYCNW
jgi:serine/threonine-protein kinase SRPK3